MACVYVCVCVFIYPTHKLAPILLSPSLTPSPPVYLMVTRIFMSMALAAGLVSWLICVLALMQHKSLWLFLSAIAYTVQGWLYIHSPTSPPPSPSVFPQLYVLAVDVYESPIHNHTGFHYIHNHTGLHTQSYCLIVYTNLLFHSVGGSLCKYTMYIALPIVYCYVCGAITPYWWRLQSYDHFS